MPKNQRMVGSSPALEDELLVARLPGEKCVQPPGDAKEWYEDKLRELKSWHECRHVSGAASWLCRKDGGEAV